MSKKPHDAPHKNGLLQEMAQKFEKQRGSVDLTHFQYGSEAGFLSYIAEAAVVFGPGDPKFSHAERERISVSDLISASKIYQDLLTCD